jgi:hypothetical protein
MVRTMVTTRARNVELDAAARLKDWLEGVAVPGRPDAFVDPEADLDPLGGVAWGDGSMIFVEESRLPSAQETVRASPAQVVGYSGEPMWSGSELSLGHDLIVQLESYATAGYIAIAFPTVLSIRDEYDRSAVLADAELAERDGHFPEYLTRALVTVMDQETWTGTAVQNRPSSRLLLGADGALYRGPRLRLEQVNDAGGEHAEASSDLNDEDDAFLAGPGAAATRFLGAARLLRMARPRFGDELVVAGYGPGVRFDMVQDGVEAAPRRDSVFVLFDGRQYLVADVGTGRVARVSQDVAGLVEATLCGQVLSPQSAEALGIALDRQHEAAWQVLARMGVGTPS